MRSRVTPCNQVEAQQGAVPLRQGRERGPIRGLEFVAIAPLQIGQLRIVGVRMRLGGGAIFQARAVALGSPDQQAQPLGHDRQPGGQRPASSIAADARRFPGRPHEQALVQRLPDLGAEGRGWIDRADAAVDHAGAGALECLQSSGDVGGAGRGQVEIVAAHRGQRRRQVDGVGRDMAGDVARQRGGIERQVGPLFLASPKQLLQRRPHVERQWHRSCFIARRRGRPGLGEGRRHALCNPFGGAVVDDRVLWQGLLHERAIQLRELESKNREL